jgi:hypothetical protein
MRVPVLPRWPVALAVSLAAPLAVAACVSVPASPVSVAPSAAPGAGTVLVVRPIAEAAAGDGAAWRAALLNGSADAAGTPPPTGAALAEFIVREDTGATFSIVQSNGGGLHPGDRVTVVHPRAAPGRAMLGPLL